MNKRVHSLMVLGVLITSFIFGGCQTDQSVQQQDQNQEREQATNSEEQGDGQKNMAVAVTVVDENNIAPAGEINEEPTVVSNSTPRYELYSADEYAELKGSKPFVLFFHANWCPICKRMEKDINEDLANYPAGTVILQTDYDTETDLKREFDINIQSTVVVFDDDGNEIYRATDPDLNDFKAAIERSLQVS